ncbi:MAG: tRNA pseudouridine32 synthase / rRNA pseudouridine746 synthase [Acetobacteraceae bacterium]|nr:tRNA pseudouridine32 synthase / rRNA pseudouridine746 synthase [Acetobacteraceae bacterium]
MVSYRSSAISTTHPGTVTIAPRVRTIPRAGPDRHGPPGREIVTGDGPTILFQDQRFVVLDKPAGLAVHAGPSGGSSVEDWFKLLSRRKDGPWLAHRLDADTAGCLVIALRHTPLLAAQAAFASGTVRKTYWAVVRGKISGDSGTITAPLRRISNSRGWQMIVDERSGQPAITDWQVLGREGATTWLELRPRTGRTHQIRVHCAMLGTPIIGDERYGIAGGGLHLLARAIHLPLDPPVDATAAPPPHMRAALAACGFHL